MRSLVLSVLALLSVSCAAQSSFKSYYDARELLSRARHIDPRHPSIPKAEIELEAGRTALNEARYSRATRSFRLVSREAEKIIVAKDPRYKPTYIDLEDEGSAETFDNLERRSIPSPSPLAPAEGENLLPEAEQEETPSRMKLPAEALARYLAQKKAASPSDKAPVPSKEAAKPKPVGTKAENKREKEVVPTPVTPPKAEAKTPAPPVSPSKEPGDELKPIPHKQTKLDTVLTFVPNEAGILPGTRDELDRMSRYLLENPSNTLVFRPALSVGEPAELAKIRFEGIRAYLEGKGVPADQVQLDDETISATTPLFQLYLIEH